MDQIILDLIVQFRQFGEITNPLFYNRYAEILSENNEETSKYLDNKSIMFKYLELLQEHNLLESFDLSLYKLNVSYSFAIKELIKNNFDCDKTLSIIMNTPGISLNNICNLFKHKLFNKIRTGSSPEYLYFKYINEINEDQIKYFYNINHDNNIFEYLCNIDDNIHCKFIKLLLSLTSDKFLEYSYLINPNLYDDIIKLNPLIRDYKNSSNSSNLLLFCAEQNNMSLFCHLINNHNFDITYKNADGSNYEYFANEQFINKYNKKINKIQNKDDDLQSQINQLTLELAIKTKKLNELKELINSFNFDQKLK